MSKYAIGKFPCKNMEFVSAPTAVGLGDAFAGGLLIDLAEREFPL